MIDNRGLIDFLENFDHGCDKFFSQHFIRNIICARPSRSALNLREDVVHIFVIWSIGVELYSYVRNRCPVFEHLKNNISARTRSRVCVLIFIRTRYVRACRSTVLTTTVLEKVGFHL
jgi:hypothetical protein